MPLDHFANTPSTFKNRYWVNDTYYKIGGPVFRMSFSGVRPSQVIDAMAKCLTRESRTRSRFFPTTCRCVNWS